MVEKGEIVPPANIVKEPTCLKSQDNPSLIDVILVAKPRRLHETVVFDTGLIDFHKIICVCTKVYVPWEGPRQIVYRSFKSFDENKYKEDISMIPFRASYIFDDIDDVVGCHNKLLSDVVDIYAPLKQRMLQKDSVPYMNSKLRKVQYRRNKLRNRYWDSKNSQNWEAYGKMRNKANVTKRQSEKVYFKGKCLKNGNQKDFWKTFNPYLSDTYKTSDNIVLKENGIIVNKPVMVCNIFQRHFVSATDGIG